MPRDEVEASYFALLRAREELAGLRRYEEYLAEDRARIHRFCAEGEALADRVDRRYRRTLRHTDEPIAEALRSRLSVIDEERTRLPDRIAAAEAFVAECEQDHAELKRGR